MSEQPAGTVIAGYRIESVIGRGGMAVVHRAEDTRLGRKVALKVLTPARSDQEQFRQRFIRESRLAASLDHPNIIPIYDAGDADGLLFIAMRYVVGTDLKVALSGDAQLAPARTLRLFTQIAAALDAAHESGLVHRDVKPANVLLTSFHGQTDHVYLSDFGLTKRASSLTGGLTATGHFLGTIDYVAPEQIAGKPVDARADIYALGCMLYESLTGRVPFGRDDDAAILWAHLVETPPPVTALRSEVPPAVDAVIARAMAKVPDERYDSCDELITDLEAALQVAAPVRESRALVRVDSSPGLDAADLEHEQQTRPPSQHPSFPPGSGLTAAPASHRRAPSRRGVAGFGSAAGQGSNRRTGRAAVLASVLVAVAALVTALVYWWPFSAARNSASSSVLNRSSGATFVKTIPVGSNPQDVAVAPQGGYAYVTNSGGSTISVINTQTQQEERKKTIRITGALNPSTHRRALWHPKYVTFARNGRRAYVSLESNDQMRGAVAIINTAQHRVVRPIIPLGHAPGMMDPTMMDWFPALSVNPLNGDLLYVPDLGHNRIDVVNLSLHKVTNRIPVAPMPHSIVFSQRSHRAYVANHTSNEVSVLNTQTDTVIPPLISVRPFSSPHSLAMSPNNKQIYVADIGSGRVSIIGVASNKVIGAIPVGKEPIDVAFLPPHGTQAYVVNQGSGNVSVIDTRLRKTFRDHIKVGKAPTSVSFIPTTGQYAYVTNHDSNSVTVISTGLATTPEK